MLTEARRSGVPTDEPAAAGAADGGGRSSRPGRRWLLLAGAVVLVALVAGVVLMSRRGDPVPDPATSVARSGASAGRPPLASGGSATDRDVHADGGGHTVDDGRPTRPMCQRSRRSHGRGRDQRLRSLPLRRRFPAPPTPSRSRGRTVSGRSRRPAVTRPAGRRSDPQRSLTGGFHREHWGSPRWRAAVTGRRPVVAVQGLGFVETAMSIAVASALDDLGEPRSTWSESTATTRRAASASARSTPGRFPFPTVTTISDRRSRRCAAAQPRRGRIPCIRACRRGRDRCPARHRLAGRSLPELLLEGFTSAIRTVRSPHRTGTLVLVETTVPPGTTERRGACAAEELAPGHRPDDVLVAHSYERVMPGAEYLASIVNYWRGVRRTDRGRRQGVPVPGDQRGGVPVDPAVEHHRVGDGRSLENTFRAHHRPDGRMGRFAEPSGSIWSRWSPSRMTHPPTCGRRASAWAGTAHQGSALRPSRLRRSSSTLRSSSPSPLLRCASTTRALLRALDRLEELMGRPVTGRHVLLLGVSYRRDVGDTRYSPSTTFVDAATARAVHG